MTGLSHFLLFQFRLSAAWWTSLTGLFLALEGLARPLRTLQGHVKTQTCSQTAGHSRFGLSFGYGPALEIQVGVWIRLDIRDSVLFLFIANISCIRSKTAKLQLLMATFQTATGGGGFPPCSSLSLPSANLLSSLHRFQWGELPRGLLSVKIRASKARN